MSDKNKTTECNMHESLVAYLYDEATAEERALVSAHLTDCATCETELQAFERVRSMLQQWQIDDLPVVRVVADRPSQRSMVALLREVFSVTPIWAKALGAVAMAMLVLAIMGTDVRVGSNGVSFHADLLRRSQAEAPNPNDVRQVAGSGSIEQVRTELRSLVNQLMADSERQQKEEIKLQLVGLESQLQNMRSADLAKLATRIQEHQQRLKSLEQDIDRREGLDLTDILFSEVAKPSERTTGGSD